LNDPILDSRGYVKVKLVDFGISKIEAQDAYEEPTRDNLGTSGFRAPETFVRQDDPLKPHVNAFKSDIFSFAMVCSYILTRETQVCERRAESGERRAEIGERKILILSYNFRRSSAYFRGIRDRLKLICWKDTPFPWTK